MFHRQNILVFFIERGVNIKQPEQRMANIVMAYS